MATELSSAAATAAATTANTTGAAATAAPELPSAAMELGLEDVPSVPEPVRVTARTRAVDAMLAEGSASGADDGAGGGRGAGGAGDSGARDSPELVSVIAAGGAIRPALHGLGKPPASGRRSSDGFTTRPTLELERDDTDESDAKLAAGEDDNDQLERGKASVWAWGCNEDGQLGLGHTNNSEFPTKVPFFAASIVAVKQISAGSRHVAAVMDDGQMYTWGWGKCGQLGLGFVERVLEPMQVATIKERVLKVCAGGIHTVAMTANNVFTMGNGTYGQLGLENDWNNKGSPQAVTALRKLLGTEDKVIDIAAGGMHTMVCSASGRLVAWGRCDNGQLGITSSRDKAATSMSKPSFVSLPDGCVPVQISCGAFHSGAVTADGKLYMWGKADYGMLGHPEGPDEHRPKLVESLTARTVRHVSCGGWHTMVVCEDGVYGFGRGEYGRLGLGSAASCRIPSRLERLSAYKMNGVSAGGSHSLIMAADGHVWTAGRGDHGRLGIGTTTTSNLPILVLSSKGKPCSHVTAAECGGAFSVIVRGAMPEK